MRITETIQDNYSIINNLESIKDYWPNLYHKLNPDAYGSKKIVNIYKTILDIARSNPIQTDEEYSIISLSFNDIRSRYERIRAELGAPNTTLTNSMIESILLYLNLCGLVYTLDMPKSKKKSHTKRYQYLIVNIREYGDYINEQLKWMDSARITVKDIESNNLPSLPVFRCFTSLEDNDPKMYSYAFNSYLRSTPKQRETIPVSWNIGDIKAALMERLNLACHEQKDVPHGELFRIFLNALEIDYEKQSKRVKDHLDYLFNEIMMTL